MKTVSGKSVTLRNEHEKVQASSDLYYRIPHSQHLNTTICFLPEKKLPNGEKAPLSGSMNAKMMVNNVATAYCGRNSHSCSLSTLGCSDNNPGKLDYNP